VISLEDAVVVVTGGAQGIGRATAARLARLGARVWIGDVDEEGVVRTADELGVRGARLDVTDAACFGAFLDRVQTDGPIDMLVNNAGVMQTGAFVDLPISGHADEIGVNLLGVVHGMRLVLPGMVERRQGHVVNLASMAAKITTPQMATYCATKFAVGALSRAVRAEIRGSGVTVSTVLPAAVRTDMTKRFTLGSVFPTSEAEDVARAIATTVRRPRPEVTIPGWLGGMDLVEAAVTESVLDRVKNLVVARAMR
jgi:short-subunit dehydrogenase